MSLSTETGSQAETAKIVNNTDLATRRVNSQQCWNLEGIQIFGSGLEYYFAERIFGETGSVTQPDKGHSYILGDWYSTDNANIFDREVFGLNNTLLYRMRVHFVS